MISSQMDYVRSSPSVSSGKKTNAGKSKDSSGGLEDDEDEVMTALTTDPTHIQSPRQSVCVSEDSEEDEMITVRAHNKKTGEVTIMKVRKGTPMKEVMSKYAQKRGVNAQKLSWKRRAVMQDSVLITDTIPPEPGSPLSNRALSKNHTTNYTDCAGADCGCTSGLTFY